MKLLPSELRNISLKWKLLIPFVFLPTALIVLLAGWGIRSQHQIILSQEDAAMRRNYNGFRRDMNLRLERALAAAILLAEDPATGQALAMADRAALTAKYKGAFEKVKRTAGLDIMHFHIYPGRSLLRLHRPADTATI